MYLSLPIQRGSARTTRIVPIIPQEYHVHIGHIDRNNILQPTFARNIISIRLSSFLDSFLSCRPEFLHRTYSKIVLAVNDHSQKNSPIFV